MAEIKKATGLMDWLDQRLAVNGFIKVMMSEYWIPKNINFLWAMGVVLMSLFMILIVSGIFLLMYYKPDIKLAFDSVNYTIMQEVEYGWLWRHMHGVAASVIFLVIYIHMFTGIYYGSYKKGREMIWLTGMALFGIFSAEAFSGYMLPWGQMSYWAAQVITNLFGGIPFIGEALVIWIRGDFLVADATLTRFFMLHVLLLPLVILLLIAVHFYALRFPHVNNQDSEEFDFDKEAKKYLEGRKKESKVVPFWPVFLSKDFFVVGIALTVFFYLVCFHYDFAMDPINFEPANNMKTPAHIYPEWYFLWSYEVLRGFFFDIGGIAAMDIGLAAFGFANVIFMLLPFLDRNTMHTAPAHKRPMFFVWFWLLLIDMIVLTVYGKLPPTGANAWVGFGATIVFLVLFVLLPIITKIEAKNEEGAES
ncbi:MAG: cytochrome bc complex cytochrome b subunit [Sulfurospirillum cavolei]|uniref:cytochrome b n=1 Tax=Sulfurospirillum TaxID=57665 RepID=UPI000541C141|nr:MULTISPECIES: cytochrome bc complex cytochrome b subunit [Sulfurospirillum]KHG33032.1 MAG: ubiquinol cytochrome C oxidoreductase [Sulfurospirillum sp. MES]MCD8545729.1 cytochrome bc complex cytochrome b subunit [Sulfurospirillum cavolei]MDY0264268.1 cytochrome bc complex cytochrome b subunit [Sulfurospirillum cavolei]